ncbi:MAG: SRPBCC domain-containing protein [Burkholderiaceae bacterium]|nr:SRPBCC domain-containing protein [Burkholderiaceae bacterium]
MIRGAPGAIWQVLTDAPAYPRWNSTVKRVVGTIALGSTVTVHAEVAPGRAFPVKVVVMDAPRRMVWRGGMPLGLFRGERVFELRPDTEGRVEFMMREDYSGLLAPLITKSIPDLQPAFDQFAACLKARVEGR